MSEAAKETVNVLVFVGAALAFAFNDSRELASACLGCAITLVTPRNTSKVPPAVIGAVAGFGFYFLTNGV